MITRRTGRKRLKKNIIQALLLFMTAMCILSAAGCGTPGTGSSQINTDSGRSDDDTVSTGTTTSGEYSDITDLLSADSDSGQVLLTTALADEEHVLALYREYSPNWQGLHVRRIALTDGSSEPLADWYIEEDVDAAPHTSWSIVCANPLVIYDSTSGIICMQSRESEGDSVITYLPDRLIGSSLRTCGKKLWLSSMDGFVYEVSFTGELQEAWTLPHQFSSLNAVPGVNKDVLSYTTFEENNPQRAIHLDYDPVSGKYELYTTTEDDTYYSASSDNYLISTGISDSSFLTLWDANTSMKYQLSSDEEQSERLAGEGLYVTVPDLFISRSSCLFTVSDSEGLPVKTYLWMYPTSPSAQPWTPPTHETVSVKTQVDYGDLSQKAAELEQTYGISIVLGENIPAAFDDYSAEPFTVTPVISSVLSRLEEIFSLYPDGFFYRLKEDYYRGITIYLTGSLTPLDTMQNIVNAAAFTSTTNGNARIAIDIDAAVTNSVIVHELTHVLDDRMIGEGWLTEEEWKALNPPGFDYYYSYIDENGESYEYSGDQSYTMAGSSDSGNVYFIDSYSKTFPTEDRARLMEYLWSSIESFSSDTDFFQFCKEKVDSDIVEIHLQEKLLLYLQIIQEHLSSQST